MTDKQKEWWETNLPLFKPFNGDPEAIPDFPACDDIDYYKQKIVPKIIELGGIPKSQLIIGKTYLGDTRNASEATWNGKEFEYLRHKWNFPFIDTVPHFEDEPYSAMFIPIKIKENE